MFTNEQCSKPLLIQDHMGLYYVTLSNVYTIQCIWDRCHPQWKLVWPRSFQPQFGEAGISGQLATPHLGQVESETWDKLDLQRENSNKKLAQKPQVSIKSIQVTWVSS